jgi:tRNA threonylcarbamoyladenosine biosynthesis protein TsaB
MLILAIDTSGKNGGVALGRGDAQTCDLLEWVPIAGGTYSAQLVPTIERLLQQRKFSLRDVDGFAVAAGPGSFTGLRVGLATVKGLAEILDRPIAAVSVLECVATLGLSMLAPAPSHRILFPALDAGRSEIFAAEYRIEAGNLDLQREMIVSAAELIAHVRGQEQSGAGLVATPDDLVLKPLAAAGMPAIKTAHPYAGDVARLGLEKLARGQITSAAVLDANYIRRSDAEIFSRPKP